MDQLLAFSGQLVDTCMRQAPGQSPKAVAVLAQRVCVDVLAVGGVSELAETVGDAVDLQDRAARNHGVIIGVATLRLKRPG